MDDTTGTATGGSTPPPPPPPGTPGRTRPPLRRTRGDRKLFGVAGGIGVYLGVDPLLVRIVFVVLALSGVGAGVVLYLACALLVPEEPETSGTAGGTRPAEEPAFVDRHGRLLAIVAGVVAGVALLGGAGPFGWGDHRDGAGGLWGLLWVALVVTVVVLVAKEVQARNGARQPDTTWTTGPSAGAAATAPPGTPGTPGGHAYGYAPPAGSTTVADLATPAPAASSAGAGVGVLTLGATLVSVGVLTALDRAGVVEASTLTVLAVALVNVGVGLVVAAFVGRARWLIALGVVLALLTAVAAVDLPGNGSVGDVRWHPRSASELQTDYRWGVGDAVLDLTDVGGTEPLRTSVAMTVGSLEVLLPADATVRTTARVGAGSIVLVGERHEGVRREVTSTLRPAGSGETDGPAANGAAADADASPGTTIELAVHLGLGELEVNRVD